MTLQSLFFWSSRAFGVVFLLAFLSLWHQAPGLFFSTGILPISEQLSLSSLSWLQQPHIFLFTSDSALHLVLGVGCLAACLFILGIVPAMSLLCCWAIYGSFFTIGSPFLRFQWDSLLLEITVLFWLGQPWRLQHQQPDYAPISLWVWRAFVACLFKLMFSSGVVKWLAGDLFWQQFQSMHLHYLTQPLPHRGSWFMAQLPDIVGRLSTATVLFIELCIPFALLLPANRYRQYACVLIAVLMGLIMLTGNYGFFPLLVCVLCLVCMVTHRAITWRIQQWRDVVAGCLCVLSLLSPLAMILPSSSPLATLVSQIRQPLAKGYINNDYGLFARMTTQRNELEIWGSMDGTHWETYAFRYKPNDKRDAPAYAGFHFPRLDWQCWFVSLRPYSQYGWENALLAALFQKSKAVENLFESVPFKKQAPTYLVLMTRQHHYSSWRQWQESGLWWQTEAARRYSPIFKRTSNSP